MFLHLINDLYSFEARSVATKGVAATKAVNTWVARQTGGLLTDALDSWGRDDFILVDTTSFKGTWQKPFYEEDTHQGDFSLPSGQKKQIPLMDQWGHYSYFRGTKFQAVRLPYGHAAMYIFLPDSDSDLRQVEQVLTDENWSRWLSQMAEHEGHLKLPRFSLQYRAEISQVLVDLGMPQVFYPVSSFSPLVMNPEGAALTRVLQAVLIKVDEKGTEAASATFVGGVIGGVSSGPKPEPFQMIVDHPFFFAICDNETQTILYMGAINDPIPLSSAR
jgi:serpin B